MKATATIPLAIALGALALLSPAPALASQQTFVGEVPTGTIGGYEVKQDIKAFIPAPPEGGYITKMETDIVDADTGKPVPIQRLMLHHIVFSNIRRQDSTCGSYVGFDSRPGAYGGVSVQRFYAAGEERAKLALPDGYGYPLEANASWAMTYMVMNHRAVPDRAMIQYTVTYETDRRLTEVKPYWLDVRDCRADPIYNVPGTRRSGSTDNETRDYTMPESGRIVAGGGHVHGGARKLTLTEPGCGNRKIAESNPTWGRRNHPFYKVRPVLHEPGPINMSGFNTAQGIPVQAGEQVRLNSLYDNSLPHTRVMGIFVIYIAPDASVAQTCGPEPTDVRTSATDEPGREGPIPYRIPLTGLDKQGQARTIKRPAGKLKRARSGATTQVKDRYFEQPNLKLRRGDKLRWQFSGAELHNVTLASGPVGIGSDNLDGGRTFARKFRKSGKYRLFCALHPVQMTQRVVVKRR